MTAPHRASRLSPAFRGDCFYGDGVQVGPFARWVLANRERAAGHDEAADRLVEEIRTSWPEAVDHDGRLLLPAVAR